MGFFSRIKGAAVAAALAFAAVGAAWAQTPVPNIPSTPFKLDNPGNYFTLTGTPFVAGSTTVAQPPAPGHALVVSVDIVDFGAWSARNSDPTKGPHIAINLLDNKSVAPFQTGPSGTRGTGFQWGSISTGAGAAIGRPTAGGVVAACEQFRKAVGMNVLSPGTAQGFAYVPAGIRVTTIARVDSPTTVQIGYQVTDLANGNIVVQFMATRGTNDNTAEFGLGVSLIVVGTHRPDGSVDSPTFANVTYQWAP